MASVHQKHPPPKVAVSVCAALLSTVIIVAVKMNKSFFMINAQFIQKNSQMQKKLQTYGKRLSFSSKSF
jgi:cytochrome c-type biogenesis protein CcmE